MSGRNALAGLLATVVSGACFYYGTGLHPHWWIAWLAPIPMLLAVPALSRSGAFLLSFIAMSLGGMNLWGFLRGVLGVPLGVVVAALCLPAVMFAVAALFFRSLSLRRAPAFAVFGPSALWVSLEYLSAVLSPHGTFGNLAYSQVSFLPVIQVASVTGIWGISFLIFLFAATVSVFIGRTGFVHSRTRLGIGVLLLFCVVFIFGWQRLKVDDSHHPSMMVMLLAKDVSFDGYPDSDPQALALFHEYAGELRRVTPAGTEVVVLPEKIARVSEIALPEVNDLFAKVAAEIKASIVVGLVRKTASAAFNESRVYSPQGGLVAIYAKHHLIPGVEPERAGAGRVVLRQPPGTWGLTICKDMDFPKLSREYSQDGAGVLLVPAWDFQVDGWLHSRMAVLRNVEGGFAQARSARSGLLTISDNRGRVLAEVASNSAPFARVQASVPIGKATTFYQRFGDWFAWVSVILVIAILVKRPSHGKQ